MVIGWQFGRIRGANGPDRLARAYLRLCARLARQGLARSAHQGPLAFAAAIPVGSEWATQARELLASYARLRFGREAPGPRQLREFEREVSRWRPPRRSVRGSRGR